MYKLLNDGKEVALKEATQIEFGSYVGEPILWDILEKGENGSPTLIVSHYILLLSKFDNENNKYATSKIRKYLNGKFYNSFTDTEKEFICPTTIDADGPTKYKNNGFVDNVFLLSKEDVMNYYPSYEDRIKTLADDKEENHYWWLRSPTSSYSGYAWYVNNDGNLYIYHVTSARYGVVPALYIQL